MRNKIALLLAATLSITTVGCSSPAEESSIQDQGIAEILAGDLVGEITVSSYDSVHQDFLENTAKAFEAKYPGTKVTIEAVGQFALKSSETDEEQRVVLETDGDVGAQLDYITRVNTALMSGGGADIYALDVLPYYKYAENGQLEDLQQYMTADKNFRAADYRMNVIEALAYKGGQYVFPLDYSFYYYDYDKSLFGEGELSRLQAADCFTVSKLFEIAEQAKAGNPTSNKIAGLKGYTDPNHGASVFGEAFRNDYGSFIDLEHKTASFADGSFAELLTQVKGWEEQDYLLPSNSAGLSVEDFSAAASEQYYYKLKNNVELLLTILRSLEGWQISIPVAGVSPSTAVHDTTAGLGAGADGSVLFDYSQGYGINANSANKALAWAFIKFMASEEIQETMQLYPVGMIYLPIHNEARMTKAKDGITGALFGIRDDTAQELELTAAQQSALANYSELVERFSDRLNAYVITDVTIEDIVHTEVSAFFAGRISAAEAADTIQSKVNRYLNE